MVKDQSDDKTKVKVEIYGEDYVMKGAAAPEHLKLLAQYVDKKMTEISKRASHLPTSKIAVLTALNIADELSKLQEDYDNLIKLIEDEKMG